MAFKYGLITSKCFCRLTLLPQLINYSMMMSMWQAFNNRSFMCLVTALCQTKEFSTSFDEWHCLYCRSPFGHELNVTNDERFYDKADWLVAIKVAINQLRLVFFFFVDAFQAFDAHVSSCNNRLTVTNLLCPFYAFRSIEHWCKVSSVLLVLTINCFTRLYQVSSATVAQVQCPIGTINIKVT